MGTLFTAATEPEFKGDAPAFKAVNSWVFPVGVAWSHLSKAGGDPVSTEAHISCVRANKVLKAPTTETDGVDFLENSGPRLTPSSLNSFMALIAAVGLALALRM